MTLQTRVSASGFFFVWEDERVVLIWSVFYLMIRIWLLYNLIKTFNILDKTIINRNELFIAYIYWACTNVCVYKKTLRSLETLGEVDIVWPLEDWRTCKCWIVARISIISADRLWFDVLTFIIPKNQTKLIHQIAIHDKKNSNN